MSGKMLSSVQDALSSCACGRPKRVCPQATCAYDKTQADTSDKVTHREVLSLEVLWLPNFSWRRHKFVKQRKGGTACHTGKGVTVKAGCCRESTGFWVSPAREHCGFQLSPCQQSPYRSYFFLPVFWVQVCSHPGYSCCCINQMVNMFL